MRFGLILNGGNRVEQPRDEAMADLLAKARTAQRCGFHSLWVGPGYLHNGMPLTDALQAIERFGREVLPRFATA